MTAPHDRPTAVELVAAVREWVERDLVGSAQGKLGFDARVAANVLAIVERELESGTALAERHAERLEALGVADDAELAARIRSGSLDARLDEVRTLVWESVRDKVAVANPKYLAAGDQHPMP